MSSALGWARWRNLRMELELTTEAKASLSVSKLYFHESLMCSEHLTGIVLIVSSMVSGLQILPHFHLLPARPVLPAQSIEYCFRRRLMISSEERKSIHAALHVLKCFSVALVLTASLRWQWIQPIHFKGIVRCVVKLPLPTPTKAGSCTNEAK